MRHAGFIFDVEGTLIDCVPQTIRSFQEALLDVGLTVSYESLQAYVGLDGDQTIELIAPQLDAHTRQQVLAQKALLYRERYLDDVTPFRAKDLFEALKAHGGKIALATDCKGPELHHYMALLQIDHLVDALACGDDVEHGKPDPRLVGVALRKLGVSATDVVLVGDSPYDAEAALEANIAATGVLTGGFSRESLSQAGCLAVARQISDLGPCLLSDAPRSSEAAE